MYTILLQLVYSFSIVIILEIEHQVLASVTKLTSIMKLIPRLSELIEPDFGLLEYLLRLEVLSRTQYDQVCSVIGAAYGRSKAVLERLKSEDQCDKLLQALKETGQQHVVNFVTQDGGQTGNISCEILDVIMKYST